MINEVEVLTTNRTGRSTQSNLNHNTDNNQNNNIPNNPYLHNSDVTSDNRINPTTDKQQRLNAIKAKLAQSRRDNHKRAKQERINNDSDNDNDNNKPTANKTDDTDTHGSDITDKRDALYYTLHDTADRQLQQHQQREEKNERAATFGWAIYNEDHKVKTHNKRIEQLQELKETIKHTDTNSAHQSTECTIDPRALLQHKPTKESIDLMLSDLNAAEERKSKFSRRRAFDDTEDQLYVNERNRQFNKKAARAYDAATVHIQQNLERGTAL